jgi:hypothetical protein
MPYAIPIGDRGTGTRDVNYRVLPGQLSAQIAEEIEEYRAKKSGWRGRNALA